MTSKYLRRLTSSLHETLPTFDARDDLTRFGDTAANVGVLTLLEAFESTRSLPLPLKSAAGSTAAGLWRIGLTPIDAYKTTLQVLRRKQMVIAVIDVTLYDVHMARRSNVTVSKIQGHSRAA